MKSFSFLTILCKLCVVLVCICVTSVQVYALQPTKTVYLYPEGAKESNGYTAQDEYYVPERGALYRTSEPRIDIYMPTHNKSKEGVTALLSCPGGGYSYTSIVNEGLNVAKYFVPRGYAVVVLKYRLPNGHENIPLSDAIRAMEILRDSATVWGLNPQKIGVIGFSAGGHLAASLVTKYTSAKSRPDFGLLVYPVISFDKNVYHGGSCRQLLGEEPTAEQIENWSLDKQVTETTPPCWLVACQDDPTVPVENSIRFYQALTAKKVPATMLLVPTGGHGWGFTRHFPMREVMEQSMISFICGE
jgi:acetyl esterase/lipase